MLVSLIECHVRYCDEFGPVRHHVTFGQYGDVAQMFDGDLVRDICQVITPE